MVARWMSEPECFNSASRPKCLGRRAWISSQVTHLVLAVSQSRRGSNSSSTRPMKLEYLKPPPGEVNT